MSSKRRKEKSYSIHGMQSILSAFISRHQFAIKPYDSYATNRVSTGCLSRCLEQFGYVKKKKTHNGKFIDIKVHLYSKSRFVTINGVLDYIIKSVQAIPSNAYSTSNSLNTHSTSNSLKKKKKMRWKRKWFISKEEKEGDGRESG